MTEEAERGGVPPASCGRAVPVPGAASEGMRLDASVGISAASVQRPSRALMFCLKVPDLISASRPVALLPL